MAAIKRAFEKSNLSPNCYRGLAFGQDSLEVPKNRLPNAKPLPFTCFTLHLKVDSWVHPPA